MVTFNTRREAESFARKRKRGFRELIKKANNDPIDNTPKLIKARKKSLRGAIKSVKIREIKGRFKGEESLFEVEGM